MTARIGEWDTQTTNERFGYVEHRVESLVAHPKFNRGSLYNDIALMFLEKPVAKLPHIGTICLPPQNETFDLRRCLLSGWGKNRYGAEGLYQAILKKIELKVVPPSYCEHMLQQTRLGVNFHLHDSFMCAGAEKGIDACDGDGGSPLVCETADHSGIYYQAGIVAWGEGKLLRRLFNLFSKIIFGIFKQDVARRTSQESTHRCLDSGIGLTNK